MKKISNIPAGNPFRVPDNYFEEVNRKIILSTSEKPVIKEKITGYRRIRFVLATAATVAILATLTYVAVRLIPSEGSETVPVFAEISPLPFLNEIDIFALEESAEAILFSDGLPGIDKSEIVDYLLQEDIDNYDIYDKL